jgi:RNA polymerase sigma-70 factor (ECF subfamily)
MMAENNNHRDCDSREVPLSNPKVGQKDEGPSDEALVLKAQQDPDGRRGRKAASELLERYQRRVYLWCFRIVGSHETAMDLAQDVLLSAFKALTSFKGSARFSSWLFAIARNRSLNAVKAVHLFQDEEVDPKDLPGPGEEPDRLVEDEEQERELFELIKRELDPLQQEVLWLRCFERMPVDEITRLLEITASSGARGVLQSARRKLRAALKKRREDEDPEEKKR